MRKHISYIKLLFLDGAINRMPVARSIIISAVLNFLALTIIGKDEVSMLAGFLAFLFVGRAFNGNEGLAKSLCISRNKQVTYAYFLFFLILLLSRLVRIILGDIELMVTSGNGISIFSWNASEKSNWITVVYITLIISAAYFMYFPLIFIKDLKQWYIYLLLVSFIWILPNLFLNIYGSYMFHNGKAGSLIGAYTIFYQMNASTKVGWLVYASIFLLVSMLGSYRVVKHFHSPVSYK